MGGDSGVTYRPSNSRGMGIDTDLMLVELREGKLPLSLSMMLALLPAIDLYMDK